MNLFLILICVALMQIVHGVELTKSEPSVNARWDAQEADSYEVCIGTKAGTYDRTIGTKETSILIDALSFDVPYYITVKAVNKFGTSDPADEIMFILRKEKRKYVVVLTSRDGGKTWESIGEVIVPKPVVVGQKYKTKITTK